MKSDCMSNPPGAHRWGTRGRKHNGPDPADMCLNCHRRYDALGVPSQHEVTPHEYPLAKSEHGRHVQHTKEEVRQ